MGTVTAKILLIAAYSAISYHLTLTLDLTTFFRLGRQLRRCRQSREVGIGPTVSHSRNSNDSRWQLPSPAIFAVRLLAAVAFKALGVLSVAVLKSKFAAASVSPVLVAAFSAQHAVKRRKCASACTVAAGSLVTMTFLA